MSGPLGTFIDDFIYFIDQRTANTVQDFDFGPLIQNFNLF